MPVTMSHPSLPGFSTVVSQRSFDSVWVHRGWVLDPPTQIQDPPGPVVHDWLRDGWGPFEPLMMTVHGGQEFDFTVTNGQGVVTGLNPGDGSHRMALVREDTNWVDSEIRSLIRGPTGWTSGGGGVAQQGHIHRVREVSPGLYEGIAVWTAVFGGGYNLLNYRAIRFDGTTLFQSGGDPATSADSPYVDHGTAVTGYERLEFLSTWVDGYRALDINRLRNIVPGDLVTVSGLGDATFNLTAAGVYANPFGNPRIIDGRIDLLEPTSTTTVAFTQTPTGQLLPASDEKRWTPFMLATRVVGGTGSAAVVEAKRWRPDDTEPDWGDPRVQRRNLATNANVPELATQAGSCALWCAHFTGGSTGSFGTVEFRRL